MHLTPAQQAAITHVEKYALARREQASEAIEEVRAMSNATPAQVAHALWAIRTYGRAVLHFHPDRLDNQGRSVAQSLLECGHYRNQFETGVSSGKLSPHPGGPRDLWENQLFGGGYAATGIASAKRPKYGALDLLRHPDGPAPRFGSCYLVLKPVVCGRCTFSYLDSHRNPAERGTLAVFEDILAALLTECFERNYALGQKDITPAALIARLISTLPLPYADPSGGIPARNLNHYIEAQVHGPVELERDAELLVGDPSFRQTRTGEVLHRLSERYGIPLQWHPGSRLSVSEVPADFRGPAMPSLARRVAKEGHVDACLIGQAAADLREHLERWQDRGSYQHCLQELKLLWHVLVRYGSPQAETS